MSLSAFASASVGMSAPMGPSASMSMGAGMSASMKSSVSGDVGAALETSTACSVSIQTPMSAWSSGSTMNKWLYVAKVTCFKKTTTYKLFEHDCNENYIMMTDNGIIPKCAGGFCSDAQCQVCTHKAACLDRTNCKSDNGGDPWRGED